MKKSYQRKRLRRLAAILSAVLAMGTAGFSPALYANPTLDSKDAAVSIGGTATDISINSTAMNNVIKWVDFSIDKNESVTFDAKNYLNYVTGSARSEIYGMLTGGGSIYLINPNGILIGDSAAINVGNLYLSTRNLDDTQLAAFTNGGADPLLTAGNVTGDVINLGKLNANSVTVEGNNITFKNVADVTKGGGISGGTITGGTVHNDSKVNLTANSDGEIHIGSDTGGELPAYTMSGTNKQYMYKLVSTAAELQAMKNNLAGNYMLAGDINMSGVSGFTPIGEDSSAAFTGRFDGLSYEIQNLVVNKDNWTNVGLFGAVQNATIENLRLVGGSIDGDESYNVGGIIGYAESSRIRNVWHTGTVEGESHVGGIVGQADEGTVIENVYNTGTVTGQGTVGGIVGYSYHGSNQIKSAYNTGNVTATNVGSGWDGVGGIAGFNHGSIENAYNTGKVTGNQLVGGIAGNNYGPYSGEGQISHVYNTGEIVGTGDNAFNIGGVVGLNTDYSTPYAKVSYAYNSGKVTGKNYVGGIVGKNYDYVEHAYNDGNVTGTSNANGIIGGLGNGGHAATDTYGSAAALFAAWGADTDGTNPAAAWRRYGDDLPILTAFLTRKDNITSRTEYNGGADVGATYTATMYSGTEAQNGYNYIKDVSIVTPKALTVTNVNKTYDGTDTATIKAANLSGVVTGDTLTVSTTSANYADKNAGTGKTVTYGGLTLSGAKAKNYTIDASGTTTGNISPKEITATFADITKTYDGTTGATAGAGTLSDVVTGDNVSVTANAAYDSKNAGSRTVNYTNVALSGADAGNYSIADTATGSGTINKANVTISVSDYTRAYDGTADASGAELTTTAGEIFAGDSMSGGTKTFTGGEDVKNVGTGKTITVDAVTINDGNGGNNYNVTYQNGIGRITRKALSLVADPVSITEGAATPTAFSGNLTGFVAGEDLAAGDSYAFHLSGTPTAVGKYAITGTLTVGGNAPAESGNYGENYTFANAEENATAFAINAKPAPAPSSGGSSGSSGGSGNFGSVTPTIPTVPTDIAPANSATSDHSASGTPSSGSAIPTNPAAPADTASNANPASAPTANPTGSPAIADAIPAARGTAAEGVAVVALAETENIASSIAADTAAHRSVASVADVGHEGLSPSSARPAPAGNPSGAAAPTGQLAGEAQNTQRFTWTAGGILAVADMAVNEPNAMSEASFAASQTARQETTPAPGRAMDGAATTASGESNAAAAGETTNPQSSDALMEQVEQTDLAIGTEESDTNNDNTAASTPANDAGEGTGDSDEKKKQR